MSTTETTDLNHRLLPQAVALVERATGGSSNPRVVDALLEACKFLEDSAATDAPIVALERDVRSEVGTYHLSVRRLTSSVPAGKFQVLITREVASGLMV